MHSWQSHTKRLEHASGESSLAASCLQVVDVSLLGILFLAPLFFGGRHPLGRFVFILLASMAGIAWFTRQTLLMHSKWSSSWANVLGLVATLLLMLQLVPLPEQWLEQMAPRNTSLLPLWTNEANSIAQLGVWQTLSLTPNSTKITLATLIAYVLLFVTTAGRLQAVSDIERMVRLIAFATILMSVFGILQYFTSNGLFFWFYEHPFTTTARAVKGSFTTRNHFAHFLVLGFGPLLAWIVLKASAGREKTFRRQPTSNRSNTLTFISLCASLGVVALAVLLSLSRGGAMALAIVSTIVVVIYYRRGFVSDTYLYGLALLGLLVVGMLSISGYEKVAGRLDDFASGSLAELDNKEGRRKIWSANVAAIQEGSLFGSGAGSHREIYPTYLPESPTKEYTHAENGYLQIITENGLLGAGLLALAIAMVGSYCWQVLRNSSSRRVIILSGAVTASLVASAAHSFVDFVWFIPSCMSLTILLAACALRLAQHTAEDLSMSQPSVAWSRVRWYCLTGTTACAASWAVASVFGPAMASIHWDRYLLRSIASKRGNYHQRVGATHQTDKTNDQHSHTEAMLYHLRNTLARNPQSSRAHLRLAGKYLQLFNQHQQVSDNAMSIDQIRDAALASQFISAEALQQWLLRAFGENSRLLYRAYYHAREALQLCPLQGEGYLYLANLCFLEGQTQGRIDAYVQQSLRVRPYDGDVLFEAGRQLMLSQQYGKALTLWKNIYPDEGTHQKHITDALVGRLHVPAASFIELFEPNWDTLRYVWKSYREHGSEKDCETLLHYANTAAQQKCPNEHPQKAANIWCSLAKMQTELGDTEAALISMQEAYRMAPSNYPIRRMLGQYLFQTRQFRQAELHLRWCMARRPDDTSLRNTLVQVTKSRMARTNADSKY